MCGYYEVVVFTDGTALYADPIITKLDPQRYATHTHTQTHTRRWHTTALALVASLTLCSAEWLRVIVTCVCVYVQYDHVPTLPT